VIVVIPAKERFCLKRFGRHSNMRNIKKNKQKIQSFCTVVSIIALVGQPMFVFAAVPLTASSVVPTTTSRSSAAAAANAATSKTNLPTVKVMFDKTAAKPGDIITAMAAPVGFAYDDDSLYYTWFLKHKSQSIDGDPNDWKVEAAKIIARGNFDKTTYTQQPFPLGTEKGYLALPGWGLDANKYLGADKTNVENADAQNCYFQDYDTGKIWEVRSSDSSYNCPVGSSAKCVQTRKIDLLPTECTDDIGGGINGGTTTPKNICVKGEGALEKPKCSITNSAEYTSKISCGAGYDPVCVKDNATVFSNNVTRADICSTFNFKKGNALGLACDDTSITATPVGDPDVSSDGETLVSAPIACTREQGSNNCNHLFPKIYDADRKRVGKVGDGFYKIDEEKAWGTNPAAKSTAGNDNNDEMNLVGLQNSTFTWTYQDGDEVGVIVEGTAQQGTAHNDASKMISWAFSKNTCPAFSREIRDHSANAQYYQDKQGKLQAGILSIDSFDANDCLKDNLIDPAVAGIGNLAVSLTYDPQNPVNVAKGADGQPNAGLSKGDEVTVSANVDNIVDASTFFYTWSIETRKTNNDGMENIDDDGWIPIPADTFDNHTPLAGIGLSKLSFKLDFPEGVLKEGVLPSDPKYVRVKLRVEESDDGSRASRTGAANAVIPVIERKTDITAYGIKIENGIPKIDKDVVICDQNTDPCIVAKNEIVAAELPNDDSKLTQFSWKYNTDNLPCDASKVPECKDNVVFFPVVGEEGGSFDLGVIAKAGSAGQSLTFSKTFNIVKPYAQIVPGDDNTGFKPLGTTSTDLDGNVTTDYSESVIQAPANSDVILKALFFPTFIRKNTQYAWSIDDQAVASQADDTATFHSGDQDTINNIDITGMYVQPAEVRKALQDIWGISPSDSIESDMRTSVQLEIPEAAAVDTLPMGAMGVPGRFFASLVTDLPSQFMFFTRIFLTMALLLLITGVLFSVIPGATEAETRRT